MLNCGIDNKRYIHQRYRGKWCGEDVIVCDEWKGEERPL